MFLSLKPVSLKVKIRNITFRVRAGGSLTNEAWVWNVECATLRTKCGFQVNLHSNLHRWWVEMLGAAVTIATAAERDNFVFISLNNRMPLAGVKDTGSSLLDKRKLARQWQQLHKQQKTKRSVISSDLGPICLQFGKPDIFFWRNVSSALATHYKILIFSMWEKGKNGAILLLAPTLAYCHFSGDNSSE